MIIAIYSRIEIFTLYIYFEVFGYQLKYVSFNLPPLYASETIILESGENGYRCDEADGNPESKPSYGTKSADSVP